MDDNKKETDKLMRAAKMGYLPDILVCVVRGADANHRDPYTGYTPLVIASLLGKVKPVCALVGASANVNLAAKATDDGYSPGFGITPLVAAAKRGHEKVARVLIASGAIVNLGTKGKGYTALMAAASRGHEGVLRILLDAGANVNQGTTGGTNNGSTALIDAARNGHENVVRALLDAGANVNRGGTDNGYTALVWAAQNGHENVARALLGAGANVNHATVTGCTALILAAKRGNEDMVGLLIDAGANVNYARSDGVTALFAAARWTRGMRHPRLVRRPRLVRLLTDCGADVNVSTNAAGHTMLMRIALDKTALGNDPRHDMDDAEAVGAAVDILARLDADVNARTRPNHFTALMLAAAAVASCPLAPSLAPFTILGPHENQYQACAVRALLDMGADVRQLCDVVAFDVALPLCGDGGMLEHCGQPAVVRVCQYAARAWRERLVRQVERGAGAGFLNDDDLERCVGQFVQRVLTMRSTRRQCAKPL